MYWMGSFLRCYRLTLYLWGLFMFQARENQSSLSQKCISWFMSLKNLGKLGFRSSLIQGSNQVASRPMWALLPLGVGFIHSLVPLIELRLEQTLILLWLEEERVFLSPPKPLQWSNQLWLGYVLIPVARGWARQIGSGQSGFLPLSISFHTTMAKSGRRGERHKGKSK